MNRTAALVLGAFAFWTLASCGGDGGTGPGPDPDTPEIASIEIAPATVTLSAIGQWTVLSATVRDEAGEVVPDAPVAWTSLDEAVVGVDTTGKATAAAPGTARIVAASGGVADTAEVVVEHVPASVVVEPALSTIASIGGTLALSVTVADANGYEVAGAEVVWWSLDGAVATVDTAGVVTAVAEGTAEIVARAGTLADTALVQVAQEAASIEIAATGGRLNAIGDTLRLSATVRDATGNEIPGADIWWASLADSVATVDDEGRVVSAGNGTASIIALSGLAADTLDVQVQQVAATVDIAADSITLDPLYGWWPAVAVADSNGVEMTGVTPAWSTSDSTTASVDATGFVSTLREGTAYIRAAVGEAADSMLVRVPGRIAFMTDRDGNAEIYVMRSNGTNPVNVTLNDAVDKEPAWSPDGSRIAFATNRDGTYDYNIYVMSATGGSPTRLTTHASWDYAPTWSPDGAKIAFVSTRSGGSTNPEIYVADVAAAGTGVDAPTRLTNNTSIDEAPAWSPDGGRIAFVSNRSTDYEIYVMDADGSNPVRLTFAGGGDWAPKWSPDGSKIVFHSGRHGSGGEIYIMNADGTDQRRLTDNTVEDRYPAFSAFGDRIIFQSTRDTGSFELYVMDLDGGNVRRLTTTNADDQAPAWKPRR